MSAAVGSLFAVGGLFALPVHAAPQGYHLVWQDEFEGSALDQSKWHINEPGDWGDSYNTMEAVSVGGGMLKITTFTALEGTDYDHHVAVLATKQTQLFKYGYFEARIQFNTSPGAYSAFWLMSPTITKEIGNPAVSGTEIDIVEHRAVDGQGRDRRSDVYTAIHWDGYGQHHKSIGDSHGPLAGLSNGTWNTYALLWTPDSYTFYFDGQEIWHRTTPISQTEQYISLSTLVEDGGWAGDIPPGGYGDRDTSTTNMLVDYVRVYQAPEPASAGVLALAALFAAARRRPRAACLSHAASR